MTIRPTITILVAEDDPDDRQLTEEALAENALPNPIRFVGDGDELLDYLRRRGDYAAPGAAPAPGLILLDLHMPGKDGREALAELKADPALRRIPVVVLTTSRCHADVVDTYDLGANSFITKPATFAGFVEAVRRIGEYWLELVALPREAT